MHTQISLLLQYVLPEVSVVGCITHLPCSHCPPAPTPRPRFVSLTSHGPSLDALRSPSSPAPPPFALSSSPSIRLFAGEQRTQVLTGPLWAEEHRSEGALSAAQQSSQVAHWFSSTVWGENPFFLCSADLQRCPPTVSPSADDLASYFPEQLKQQRTASSSRRRWSHPLPLSHPPVPPLHRFHSHQPASVRQRWQPLKNNCFYPCFLYSYHSKSLVSFQQNFLKEKSYVASLPLFLSSCQQSNLSPLFPPLSSVWHCASLAGRARLSSVLFVPHWLLSLFSCLFLLPTSELSEGPKAQPLIFFSIYTHSLLDGS